ncbi:hypothetical protein E2562_015589 [Oryza meyeriana var. granulata]|uniref:Uncharacterized protein n=1 Tax=Oryza meyeriana var. granulata TaxID=110450 RepID=A0A6G1EK17_9ORYZ|nr:hypothetical protein E2562_015589 [Oryza meyeriana var. granulata]
MDAPEVGGAIEGRADALSAVNGQARVGKGDLFCKNCGFVATEQMSHMLKLYNRCRRETEARWSGDGGAPCNGGNIGGAVEQRRRQKDHRCTAGQRRPGGRLDIRAADYGVDGGGAAFEWGADEAELAGREGGSTIDSSTLRWDPPDELTGLLLSSISLVACHRLPPLPTRHLPSCTAVPASPATRTASCDAATTVGNGSLRKSSTHRRTGEPNLPDTMLLLPPESLLSLARCPHAAMAAPPATSQAVNRTSPTRCSSSLPRHHRRCLLLAPPATSQ